MSAAGDALATPALRVRAGRVRDGARVLLDGIDLEVPPGRIAVVLGPGGVGKSTLLRALAGVIPSGWSVEGTWEIAPPGESDGSAPSGPALFVPQTPRSVASATAEEGARELVRALARRPVALLIDEPRAVASEDPELDWIAALLALRAEGTAALVVTHDLSLTAHLADDVLLVYDGRIVARGAAPAFFDDPPNTLARQFLKHGNCSPPPRPPELPSHFRWIEPGRLAGMGRPGLLGEVEQDLEAIAAAGISHLVTLTEEAPPLAEIRAVGIESLHLPIVDMGVPSLANAARAARSVSRWMDAGSGVAVHCHAGLGRTGLLLAAVRIWNGASAEQALAELRAICPAYVQSRAQELFLARFAEEFGPRPAAPVEPA